MKSQLGVPRSRIPEFEDIGVFRTVFFPIFVAADHPIRKLANASAMSKLTSQAEHPMPLRIACIALV